MCDLHFILTTIIELTASTQRITTTVL